MQPSPYTSEQAAASVPKLVDAPPFILGSKSGSRRAILTAAGGIFDVVVADIDEKGIGNRNVDPPAELVQVLSCAAECCVLWAANSVSCSVLCHAHASLCLSRPLPHSVHAENCRGKGRRTACSARITSAAGPHRRHSAGRMAEQIGARHCSAHFRPGGHIQGNYPGKTRRYFRSAAFSRIVLRYAL